MHDGMGGIGAKPPWARIHDQYIAQSGGVTCTEQQIIGD